jgi:hypothetical protein
MNRTLLAAGFVALIASGGFVAVADDMNSGYWQPYGPNWGAPNSPYYGPTTQSAPPRESTWSAPLLTEGRSAFEDTGYWQPYGPNWGRQTNPTMDRRLNRRSRLRARER